MDNNFPTTPVIKDGKATLEWQNQFGETITVELDIAKAGPVPVPASVIQTSSLEKSFSRLPILILHSDDLIPCPLTPIVTKVLGMSWPTLIIGTDGNKYILDADEAGFIERACKVLIEYGNKLQKQ